MHKKRNLKAALVVALIIAAGLLAAALAFFLANRATEESTKNSTNSINLDPPSQEQLSEGDRIKEKSLVEDESVPSSSNVEMYFTASFVNNDSYRLRVFITKISSEGTCNLTLTSQGNESVAVPGVGVQPLPDGSTCKGFDIPLADLAASDTWVATVEFKGTNLSGQASKEILL